MARGELHPLFQSLRGALGNVVFKHYGDRIVVSRKPDMSRRTLSEKQRAHHERVRQAAAWGRTARDTPELAEVYGPVARERRQGVYHVAFGDAMRAPEIRRIDASGFSPAGGGTVTVEASDDFEVVRVEVELLSASGEVLLSFEARRNGDRWTCSIDADPAIEHAARIRARAFDRPGNVAESVVDGA